MSRLDLGRLQRVLLAAAAAAVALAVLVWALVTWWLPVLAILAAAGLLVVLLRHGDRLTLAYWPRHPRAQAAAALPASSTGQQAPAAPEMAKPDEWLS